MSTITAPVVTDGEKLICANRAHELFGRFKKNVYLNPQQVLDGLQQLIDGKALEVIPTVVPPVSFPAIPPGKKWIEIDGVIYISVTSNGRSDEEWITYLESKGTRLSKYAKDVLRSPDFKATTGVTYNLAVLRGTSFTDKNRVTRKIRAEAEKRGWSKPAAEVGCLIRDLLSDAELEELNLWYIVAMHEPIEDSDRDPRLLDAHRHDDGLWLDTSWGRPDSEWVDDGAFGFLVSQVQN